MLGSAFRDLALGCRVRLVVAEDESLRGPQASTVELSAPYLAAKLSPVG